MPPIAIEAVRQALARPRPGPQAHVRMAPAYRREEVGTLIAPPDCRRAGVLVLLFPQDGALRLPLTRRPQSVEFHKGQISLPGGAVEAGESPDQTALRETGEEIGVPSAEVELLGPLSPLYVPPSNFSIQPWVGWTPRRPLFRIEPTEVAELIEAPLDVLLDPATVQVEEWHLQGGSWPVPFYRLGPHKVWGATAMILTELLTLLRAG